MDQQKIIEGVLETAKAISADEQDAVVGIGTFENGRCRLYIYAASPDSDLEYALMNFIEDTNTLPDVIFAVEGGNIVLSTPYPDGDGKLEKIVSELWGLTLSGYMASHLLEK